MIVETATFRLRPDADRDAAVAADHRVQVDFAHRQPGLLRRTTARAADGDWLVVTLWHTEADALAATAVAAGDPAVAALAALVSGTPVVRRYEDLGG